MPITLVLLGTALTVVALLMFLKGVEAPSTMPEHPEQALSCAANWQPAPRPMRNKLMKMPYLIAAISIQDAPSGSVTTHNPYCRGGRGPVALRCGCFRCRSRNRRGIQSAKLCISGGIPQEPLGQIKVRTSEFLNAFRQGERRHIHLHNDPDRLAYAA